MKLAIKSEDLINDVENMVRIFSADKPEISVDGGMGPHDVVCEGRVDGRDFNISISIGKNADKKSDRNSFKKELYSALSAIYGKESPYGILVGVRPVKIVHGLIDAGHGIDEVKAMLMDDYLIRKDKVDMLVEIALVERRAIFPVRESSVCMYVSIPFCKSRCYYCSFPGLVAGKFANLMNPYVDALVKELKAVGEYLKRNDAFIDVLYIGGGTPTAIDHENLERIISEIKKNVDLSNIKEFTIEAGRPDTIDDRMLDIIYKSGADRICINPQSMCDKTLDAIGRSHDSKSISALYGIIDKGIIKSINMDVIAGLDGETVDEFTHTIRTLCDMAPENITVHTLSVKRGSKLKENKDNYDASNEYDVEEMVEISKRILRESGYIPYYMYRQKNIVANLDNVGYSKEGHECIYNMRIMTERNTFIGLGAGSSSKLFVGDGRFERHNNIKSVHDYIGRIDDIIAKKIELLSRIVL